MLTALVKTFETRASPCRSAKKKKFHPYENKRKAVTTPNGQSAVPLPAHPRFIGETRVDPRRHLRIFPSTNYFAPGDTHPRVLMKHLFTQHRETRLSVLPPSFPPSFPLSSLLPPLPHSPSPLSLSQRNNRINRLYIDCRVSES